MNILRTSLPIVGIGLLVYILGMFILQQAGQLYSNAPTWLFRFVVLAGATVAIVRLRLLQGNLISFTQGVSIGMLTSVALGVFISLHTYVQRTHLSPEYNTHLRDIVRANLERETDPKWTEEQIRKQLDERWGFYFTTTGGMTIDLISSTALGFMAALSVGYMARRVKVQGGKA